jgi:hypothetical protein
VLGDARVAFPVTINTKFPLPYSNFPACNVNISPLEVVEVPPE